MRNPFNGQFMSTKVYGFDLEGDNSLAITIGAFITLAAIIFGGGFWSGFYSHIQMTSGYDLSSNETIILTFVNATCKTFNTIPTGQQASSICQEGYSTVNSEVNLEGFIFLVLPIIIMILLCTMAIGSLDGESLWLFVDGFIIGVIASIGLNWIGYVAGFAFLGGYATIPIHTTSTSITTTTFTSSTTSTTSTTTIIYRGTCKASSGFVCVNASLSQESKLTVMFGQEIVPIMYNIQIGCGNSTRLDGRPNAQFYNEPFNLTKEQFRQIDNMTCTGSRNGTFTGYVWINYTKLSGKPSAYKNSYYENEVAYVNIP